MKSATLNKVLRKGKTQIHSNDNIFCAVCHCDNIKVYITYKHIDICQDCEYDMRFYKENVRFVRKQTGCSKKRAKATLEKHNNDAMKATAVILLINALH